MATRSSKRIGIEGLHAGRTRDSGMQAGRRQREVDARRPTFAPSWRPDGQVRRRVEGFPDTRNAKMTKAAKKSYGHSAAGNAVCCSGTAKTTFVTNFAVVSFVSKTDRRPDELMEFSASRDAAS
jgi:hypothetical protein